VNNLAEDTGTLYYHTVEVEQMMECLQTEIRTNQAKMSSLASWIDAWQARMDSHHEMMAIVKVSLGKTEARIESGEE
jgi:peptidoglycan hydrolase CwlO-like protein